MLGVYKGGQFNRELERDPGLFFLAFPRQGQGTRRSLDQLKEKLYAMKIARTVSRRNLHVAPQT